MDNEAVSDKTAFIAGRIAALIGRKTCPYSDKERSKALSWRCGWVEGEAERLLQARRNERKPPE